MSTRKSSPSPTPQSIAEYVKKNASKVQETQKHQHAERETIRQASYKGHRIVVHTTYRIEVDGVPLTGHMGVTNDGQVHYHPVPNLSFDSAVDLVKQLIDIFPDDFGKGRRASETRDAHAHGSRPRRKAASKPKSKGK